MQRNPDVVSFTSTPDRARTRNENQRITNRRDKPSRKLCAPGKKRLPMTSCAPDASWTATRSEISSGGCWPSPSHCTTRS